MNIGKKIKKIRNSRGMTQSELAGDHITRNMLSQIENGSATPSVSTIVYISQKLGMPAGYFLAESENDFLYNKMLCIDSVKQAYKEKKYKECIDICKESLREFDDEIYMILCECSFRLGQSSFEDAHLVSAHREFNTALQYSEKTIYNVEWIRIASYVYLEFIGNLLPSLRFESIHSHYIDADSLVYSNMYTYVKAKKLLSENKIEEVGSLFSRNEFCETIFSQHIKALIEMKNKDYDIAYNTMQNIINSEECNKHGRPILFAIYSDMEVCCRENRDFEHAYEYATKKSEIIPEMGK